MIYEIKLRRVEAAGARKVIFFHLDAATIKTMQVALNDESEYDAGRLVYATEAGLHLPTRMAGSTTIHDNTIPHAVNELPAGVRFGLFFLESMLGEVEQYKYSREEPIAVTQLRGALCVSPRVALLL